MTGRWQAAKRDVVRAAQEMTAQGLVTGTSGNISVRLEPTDERELMAVTPSGKRYSGLREDDIVVADFQVEPVEGDLVPSSEALLHTGIYKARPDVKAVIHTHSVFASVAAVAGLDIPPIIDEMVVRIGGPVLVSEYAFPGTEEVANNVCRALGERKAALIRNHGVVGVGGDLNEALEVCALTERVAQIFVYSSLLGKVNPLPKEIVDTEISLYRMRQDAERRE